MRFWEGHRISGFFVIFSTKVRKLSFYNWKCNARRLPYERVTLQKGFRVNYPQGTKHDNKTVVNRRKCCLQRASWPGSIGHYEGSGEPLGWLWMLQELNRDVWHWYQCYTGCVLEECVTDITERKHGRTGLHSPCAWVRHPKSSTTH